MTTPRIITDIDREILNGLIGLWDGDVIEIDFDAELLYVNLRPLYGSDIEVMGEIPFNKLEPEDIKTIEPGAIFQLQQYKLNANSTATYQTHIVFSKEVWTEEMIEEANLLAKDLFSKINSLKT